jgi:hypothetical protein
MLHAHTLMPTRQAPGTRPGICDPEHPWPLQPLQLLEYPVAWLHTTANHGVPQTRYGIAWWSTRSDPGVRATQVGGFTFGGWDPRHNVIQVHAEKARHILTTITLGR